jgi:photosystem II stability/assembly factor-like uncharacterized protein
VDSDRELKLQINDALDAVLPPAPWLEDAVRRDIRSRSQRAISPSNRRRLVRPNSLFPVVAGLLTILLIAGLILAAHTLSLSRTAPALHPPTVKTRTPISIFAPLPDCGDATGCQWALPTFTSPSVGWTVAELSDSGTGLYTLYRTDDRGVTWRGQFSWANSIQNPKIEVKASANGKVVLVITAYGSLGAGMFSTLDGGLHWNSVGLPLGALPSDQCPAVLCAATDYLPRLTFDFLNPREGWVIANAPEAGVVVDILHTTDGGSTWSVSGHVSDSTPFNFGAGHLAFEHSGTAIWFIPNSTVGLGTPRTLYRSRDGGKTWGAMSVPAADSSLSDQAAIVQLKFFNDRQGVLELRRILVAEQMGTEFVSTTSDGGATWSVPHEVPVLGFSAYSGRIDFVDAVHWIGAQGRVLVRTSDAGAHWERVSFAVAGVPAGRLIDFYELDFVDASHGLALMRCDGAVLATSDGGSTWTGLQVPGMPSGFTATSTGFCV